MTLTLGRTDLDRGPWSGTILIILAWTLWLLFISLFSISDWIRLPMTGLVLVYAARMWNWIWAGFALLIISWIFHQWSEVPPGLFWLAAYLTFLVLKAFISQFELDSFVNMMIALVIAFALLEFIQLFFFYRLFKSESFSWALVGAIILSSFFQAILSIAFHKPLRGVS